ncbi:MAG: DNA cytosine methyltransferase [Bacillota bacterium]
MKNKSKRIKGVSLFSNVGIAETYLAEIGVDIVVANELIEERAQFYQHLYPKCNMICGDITNKDTYDKVINSAREQNVELLIATPPCQGMSCAGKKDPNDERNSLIYYAVQVIKDLNPQFVIIENVPMQQHTKIMHDNELIKIPEYMEIELGDSYKFNQKRIVNTKDFGVAQSRQRYIYLLTKKELDFSWEIPTLDLTEVTLQEAIGNLPSLDPCLREEDEKWRFPDYAQKEEVAKKISKWHKPPVHSWKQVEWMMHTPSAKSAFGNDVFYPKTKGRRIKGAPRTYMRMDWNKPATTIMQNSGVISAFSTVHPGRLIVDGNLDVEREYSDARTLSIYELLILSSLPLDWDIPSWASDILIRKVIGEGIPPLLIKWIVLELLKEV